MLHFVASKQAKESYKANIIDFYAHYCDFKGIRFSKPKYHRDHKLPYVPTKEELELFINHADSKYSLIYSIMRDTGMRPVEVSEVYVNGIKIGSRSTSGSFNNQNVNLAIGCDPNPFHGYLNGTIDNAMLYSRALSTEEIVAHYLLPPP